MKSLMLNCSFFLLLAAFAGCNSNPGKNKYEKIDYIMQQAYKDQEFVGNVLVADSGQVIYKKSFGKSDAEKRIENSDTTKFLIASISKPFTAIIILRLYDKGLLELEDPISKFFTVKDPEVGKITVHQLLTHSSGINEFINKEKNFDLNALLNKATLNFKPGSDFEYSNSAFVLLIKIAEKLATKPYEYLVRAEVFDVAGMNSSGVGRNDQNGVFAKGYKDASQKLATVIDFPLENVDGAGSIYSTTEDLYKLDQALRTDQLLTPKSKALMVKQQIPEKYGYGWFIRERGGNWDTYWAKGDLPGVTTYISRMGKKDQVVILLGNVEQLDVSGLENDIAKVLKTDD